VGRSLVHSVRDPELLACIKTALEQRVASSGRASTLAPGLIFEINAVPMTSGGALVVLHDVTRIEAAESPAATSSPTSATSCAHHSPLSRATWKRWSRSARSPKPRASFSASFSKNATRMNRITEDLLALAGVESPDYKLALQPTRASALVGDAIDLVGGMVVDSGVALEMAGAPDALVLADADAMNQVFGNLVENALRYGKPANES